VWTAFYRKSQGVKKKCLDEVLASDNVTKMINISTIKQTGNTKGTLNTKTGIANITTSRIQKDWTKTKGLNTEERMSETRHSWTN